MVIIGSHNNKVFFNVTSSLTNPIIVGLSWFVLHNPRVDWKMRSFHFEFLNETKSKCEVFLTSTLDFEHDFAHEDPTRTS
jgi:hypothetical protein